MITDDDEDNGCPMETVTKENIKKKPANDLKDRKIRLIEIALSEISKEYVRYFVHEELKTSQPDCYISHPSASGIFPIANSYTNISDIY